MGFALQRHQAQRLAHHGVGLRRNGGDGRIARAAGRCHLDVGHAGVFGLRQVKGHVHQRHALGVGLPVRGVTAPVGHGLQYGDAQALELGAAHVGREHDLRVDEHVGQRRALGAQHAVQAARVHHGAVERQRHGAPGLDARDQVVDVVGLHGGDVLLVHGQRDHGAALSVGRVHPRPAQVGLRVGKHLAGRARVVHGGFGKDHRIGHALGALALQKGSDSGHKALEVLPPAVAVVVRKAAAQGLIHPTAPGGPGVVQPGVRRAQAGQRAGQVLAHVVLLVGVEEHHVLPLEQPGIGVGRDLAQVAHLHINAVRARNVGQQAELARRHVGRGDEQHRGRLRSPQGPYRQKGQQAQGQPAAKQGHGVHWNSLNKIGL